MHLDSPSRPAIASRRIVMQLSQEPAVVHHTDDNEPSLSPQELGISSTEQSLGSS